MTVVHNRLVKREPRGLLPLNLTAEPCSSIPCCLKALLKWHLPAWVSFSSGEEGCYTNHQMFTGLCVCVRPRECLCCCTHQVFTALKTKLGVTPCVLLRGLVWLEEYLGRLNSCPNLYLPHPGEYEVPNQDFKYPHYCHVCL